MPALANVPNVGRINLSFNTGTVPLGGIRIFMFWSTNAPSANDCNLLAAKVANAWQGTLAGLTHENISLVDVTVTDLTSNTAFQGGWTGQYYGEKTGTQLPVDNCVLVNYAIHTRYRGGKPRTYWPGGVDTDVVNGQTWSTTFQQNFTNLLNNFNGQIQSTFGNAQWGPQACVHYYSGHQENTSGGIWDPAYVPKPYPPGSNAKVDTIYGIQVSGRIGSQRRRLRLGS